MNSSPFTAFFSDPLLPPLAGGPSEEFIDFFPTASSSSSSFAIDPNGLFSHQKPSWEDQKWTEQQNWNFSFTPTLFDPTYEFNPPQPPFPALNLSSECTSPSSSRSSFSFDASPISSLPLFPSQIFDLDDDDHSPTPQPPQPRSSPSKIISTLSRGRKRVAPASFAEDDEDSSSSPRKLRSSKGKKVKEEDEEEDEGSDFDGSEEGGSQVGRGGRRKGAKSIVDKKERRKATNRASAKAFRARRKNLLNDIQTQISERDAEIRDLQFLITRLRDEKSKILVGRST